MVMPYRQAEMESVLQRIFEAWQDHLITVQWVESLQWSAKSQREAHVGGVYPHGVQLLLKGECGAGPIPYWLSWIELGLNPELIETQELQDAVTAVMTGPRDSPWVEAFAGLEW
jgi:hypothetical protein